MLNSTIYVIKVNGVSILNQNKSEVSLNIRKFRKSEKITYSCNEMSVIHWKKNPHTSLAEPIYIYDKCNIHFENDLNITSCNVQLASTNIFSKIFFFIQNKKVPKIWERKLSDFMKSFSFIVSRIQHLIFTNTLETIWFLFTF